MTNSEKQNVVEALATKAAMHRSRRTNVTKALARDGTQRELEMWMNQGSVDFGEDPEIAAAMVAGSALAISPARDSDDAMKQSVSHGEGWKRSPFHRAARRSRPTAPRSTHPPRMRRASRTRRGRLGCSSAHRHGRNRSGDSPPSPRLGGPAANARQSRAAAVAAHRPTRSPLPWPPLRVESPPRNGPVGA
jgi:hypothetical protein